MKTLKEILTWFKNNVRLHWHDYELNKLQSDLEQLIERAYREGYIDGKNDYGGDDADARRITALYFENKSKFIGENETKA